MKYKLKQWLYIYFISYYTNTYNSFLSNWYIFIIILKIKMHVTFDKIRVTNTHVYPGPLQERKISVTCSRLIELFTNFCMFMKIQWKNWHKYLNDMSFSTFFLILRIDTHKAMKHPWKTSVNIKMLYVRVDLHVYFMIDESTFYYVFFDVLYILLLYSILKGKYP